MGPRGRSPMRVRFQADANFNEEIVSGLIRQKPDVDFQAAEEAELRGMATLKY
jgi:hypothetical protein